VNQDVGFDLAQSSVEIAIDIERDPFGVQLFRKTFGLGGGAARNDHGQRCFAREAPGDENTEITGAADNRNALSRRLVMLALSGGDLDVAAHLVERMHQEGRNGGEAEIAGRLQRAMESGAHLVA
jgi:hypothetical protein